MADWFETAQDFASSALKAVAADRQQSRQQSYEIEKLRLEALGQNGYYTEGQPNRAGSAAGISPTVLLIGAAVVAFMLVKD